LDEEIFGKEQEEGSDEINDAPKKNNIEAPIRSYEYLVIYMHFLDRMMKRLISKDFKVIMDVTEIEGIKLSIVEDPNGIQVRFLEMPDHFVNVGKTFQVNTALCSGMRELVTIP
jgi:hypothetical protein